MAQPENQPKRKRGIVDIGLAVVAVILIMSPSYISRILSHRVSVDVSILAVASLGLFLVGIFLLLKVLRD